MGDCLAHPEVGEFLAAVIDLHDELVGQGLVALGNHLDAVDLGYTVEIGERHRREGGKLDFVCFERRSRRLAIRQHAVDDLVEFRLILFPIILIACQPIIFAGLVFGEFERAGADQCIIGCIGGDIGAVENMFGDDAGYDRQRITDELERRRLGEAEDGGVIVGRIDGFEIGEDQTAEILQRLPDLERGEGDIERGERLAVMPGDAVAQLEGDGEAVGRTFPGGGKARRKPVLASNEASASGSTTLLAMKKTPFEATMAGLRFFGSESAATTSRPPLGAACARACRASAVEANSRAVPFISARREISGMVMSPS